MTNASSSSQLHTLNILKTLKIFDIFDKLNIFNKLIMIRQRNFCTNAIRKIDIIITIKKPFSYFITKNVNRITTCV